jgi:3-hydroxyisobutyrate dehydrogenase-like beta-hydroxyacid dehydrogenase
MEVGFIGVGRMGLPIAQNLLAAGHTLIVYNRTRSRAELLRDGGAHIAGSVAETADAEIVMTLLADDHALEEVVLGTDFLSRLKPGTIHVSMSTISVALSRRLTETHAKAGSVFVSAVVFGRPAAETRQLLVVAAGPPDAVERCRPLFTAIGSRTEVIASDPPAANVFKLAGNFLIAAVMESLGEAFALLRKSEVAPARFLEIMTGTLFAAPVYKTYGKLIAEEQFSPAGFAVPLGLKDVRLVLAAADAASVPMPVANVVRDHLLTAQARGRQDLDWSSLAKVVAENAGL